MVWKWKFVRDDQLAMKHKLMVTIDSTVVKVPTALKVMSDVRGVSFKEAGKLSSLRGKQPFYSIFCDSHNFPNKGCNLILKTQTWSSYIVYLIL